MRLCACSLQARGQSCFNPRTRTGCDPLCLYRPKCGNCFNPRTRTGCDIRSVAYLLEGILFQSTHPHGVRPSGCFTASFAGLFQSTHPHGVRRFVGFEPLRPYSFNPRTRTGCDPSASSLLSAYTGFNPRTRTGCDWGFCLAHSECCQFQSTHPHGVRHLVGSMSGHKDVSIHAPARGATMPRRTKSTRPSFQSTHPHGVRHESGVDKDGNPLVSIHAPARGATTKHLIHVSIHWFQSTHPHGVRLLVLLRLVLALEFQSTHPHGVRPYTQQ